MYSLINVYLHTSYFLVHEIHYTNKCIFNYLTWNLHTRWLLIYFICVMSIGKEKPKFILLIIWIVTGIWPFEIKSIALGQQCGPKWPPIIRISFTSPVKKLGTNYLMQNAALRQAKFYLHRWPAALLGRCKLRQSNSRHCRGLHCRSLHLHEANHGNATVHEANCGGRSSLRFAYDYTIPKKC